MPYPNIETKHGHVFRVRVFGDTERAEDASISVVCMDNDDSGQPLDGDAILAWPSNDEIGAVVGFPVRFRDSGDHPFRCEAIYAGVQS